MDVYLITFDLHDPSYKDVLANYLRDLGSKKIVESSHVVTTDGEPQEIASEISMLVDKKIDVFVLTVSRPWGAKAHRGDESELAELAFTVMHAVEAGVDHRIRGCQCRTCAWAGACSP